MDKNEIIPPIPEEKELQLRKYRVKFWVWDILTIIIAYFIAYAIKTSLFTKLVYSNEYVYLLLLIIPTFFILIRRSSFTHIHEEMSFKIILFNFSQLCLFGLLIIFFFLFIFKMKEISRIFVIVFFVTYFILISILQLYRSRSYRSIWKDIEINN
jgi:hypothetical protein